MVDAALHRDLRMHLEEIRFLAFGRALPAVLFAVLGYRVLLNLVGQIRAVGPHPGLAAVAAGPLPTSLYLLFCAIPVGVYLVRPRPAARDGRIAARAAGLVGTCMLLAVGALPTPIVFAVPAALSALATPIAILAFSLAIFGLLHLRRNLSIIPEARRLVTSGPYRVIRHPLYAGEMLAAVAVLLPRPGLWGVIALAPYFAVQLLRAHFEEQLLGRAFPQYREYRQHTWRLVPLVW